MPTLVAIIPAYNEEKTIRAVIRSVRPKVSEVIVVNDGSNDGTEQIAQSESAVVVNHRLNCGLGAALATGLAIARMRNADMAVTIDADDQMFAEDIQRICAPLVSGSADVVIGSRFLDPTNRIPILRRIYNRVGNFFTWALFGIRTTDSQSGVRGFSRHAIRNIQLRCSRMEVSSELFAEIRQRNLRWREVPVRVQYTPYSLSKGQGLLQGMRTLARLALRR